MCWLISVLVRVYRFRVWGSDLCFELVKGCLGFWVWCLVCGIVSGSCSSGVLKKIRYSSRFSGIMVFSVSIHSIRVGVYCSILIYSSGSVFHSNIQFISSNDSRNTHSSFKHRRLLHSNWFRCL